MGGTSSSRSRDVIINDAGVAPKVTRRRCSARWMDRCRTYQQGALPKANQQVVGGGFNRNA